MKYPLVLLISIAVTPGFSAILPGVIGPYKQISAAPLEVTVNRPLWDEYGLQDSQQGVYRNAAGHDIRVEAWRLADSTASLAAFELVRPPQSRPAPKFEELTPVAALTPSGALVALGNYLVRFTGAVPEADAVANMFRSMTRFENSGLPIFPSYLPDRKLPNSERYIGGPVALQEFAPEIQSGAAGFRFGAEAALAVYPSGATLLLFSYPTPGIARDREPELAKTTGAFTKRTGPLVAVVLRSSDRNAAESLLAQIRYRATVTTGQKRPSKWENPGNLLLNICYLILILAAFCLASGLLFGAFRVVSRRTQAAGNDEEILALHLERR